LILFVNPDEECLGIIVVNTSVIGPISVDTTGLKESVSFLEEEMVGNELLLFSSCHGSESIVFSFQLSIETLKRFKHITLNFTSLLRSIDSRTKWVTS
jgi:hypothetical protein